MKRTPFNETHMSNNNFSLTVSLFRNFRETYPTSIIELGSWLCSDEFRVPIESIRKSQKLSNGLKTPTAFQPTYLQSLREDESVHPPGFLFGTPDTPLSK